MHGGETAGGGGAGSTTGLRLFVALELPEAVRRTLAGWQTSLVAQWRGLRPVAPESLHVTVCFLGPRAPGEVEAVARACDRIHGLAVRGLSLGGALRLPPRRPRVVAVALLDPHGELALVHRQLSMALIAAGALSAERTRFRGHVTVARIGRAADPAPLELSAPPRTSFEAGHLTLYRSELGRGPARYAPMHRVALGSRGPFGPGIIAR